MVKDTLKGILTPMICMVNEVVLGRRGSR